MSGVMEADSQRAVVAQLREQGFFPISIEERQAEDRGVAVVRSLVRIRLKDRNHFFRQLASLLESGMPILRALGTLRDQATNHKLHKVLDELHD